MKTHALRAASKSMVAALTVIAMSLAGVSCSSSSAGADNTGPSSSGNSSKTSGTCKPKWQFPTLKKGTLSLVGPDEPPQYAIDPNTKKPEGIGVKLMDKFAAEACLTPHYEQISGAAAVAGMSKGLYDVGLGGWGKTAERAKSIGQMKGYTVLGFTAIYTTSKKLTKLSELKGLSVGVEGGSLYQAPLTKYLNGQNVHVYQSQESELRDLKAGRVDAVFSDVLKTTYLANNVVHIKNLQIGLLQPDPNYPELTEPVESNFVFTKGNQKLGDALDAFVKEQKANGYMDSLYENAGIPKDEVEKMLGKTK